MNTERIIKRGQVFYVDFGQQNVIGSEQSGVRPVVVIQNNIGNKFSPTVIVAAITSQTQKRRLPTQVVVSKGILPKESMIMVEQTKTISKARLRDYLGTLSDETMTELNKAIAVSFGLKVTTREEIEAEKKVDRIYKLDVLIELWQSHKNNTEEIADFITERQLRLKDLNKYCNENGFKIANLYKPNNERRNVV